MSGPAPKTSIQAIKPYTPGKAKAAGFSQPVKLSANENALGSSPAARAAYLEAAASLNLYPDPTAAALREALAAKHGIEAWSIVFGNGSDELFSLACQAYLDAGDNIVQPQFAFAAWAIAARAAGGAVKSVPERDYTVDVDAMLTAVDARTRIVFIANPANPTGTCLPFGEIERLHAGLPPHVLLVLDGAYAEFGPGGPRFVGDLALARRAQNVLATRTFSKLHGLAALRIGWGCAAPGIAETLNRIRLPFNASTPAQMAACAALGDDGFVETSVAHAVTGRVELAAFLAGHGLRPIPSAANFVTAVVPEGAPLSAAALERGLAEQGVLARWLGSYAMPDAIRVTVGDAEGMRRFKRAFAQVMCSEAG
jgi:histidinol-phosphate aminotransferase